MVCVWDRYGEINQTWVYMEPSWTWRRNFSVDTFSGSSSVLLHFEGVDTVSTITVSMRLRRLASSCLEVMHVASVRVFDVMCLLSSSSVVDVLAFCICTVRLCFLELTVC